LFDYFYDTDIDRGIRFQEDDNLLTQKILTSEK